MLCILPCTHQSAALSFGRAEKACRDTTALLLQGCSFNFDRDRVTNWGWVKTTIGAMNVHFPPTFWIWKPSHRFLSHKTLKHRFNHLQSLQQQNHDQISRNTWPWHSTTAFARRANRRRREKSDCRESLWPGFCVWRMTLGQHVASYQYIQHYSCVKHCDWPRVIDKQDWLWGPSLQC